MAKKFSKSSNKKPKLQVGALYDPFGIPSEFDDPRMTQSKLALGKIDGEPEKSKKGFRNPFENIKGHDMIQLGLYGIDAALTHNEALRNQENYNRRFPNVMTQKPIWGPNYGDNQAIIKAEHGAEIRKTTSPMFGDVEVEGGEFIQLPDLTTQYVQGATHEKGGVHTNLPNGTRVFSDHLKPLNSKKTYAQLAKKYDTAKWQKILDNPFATDPDRNTAKLMFDRHESILNELFADQQKQNGNSDGTNQAVGKFGLDLKKGEALSFMNPFYQDGGMFPWDSTFYDNPEGDPSVLNLTSDTKGKSKFQDGGKVRGNKRLEELRNQYEPNPKYEYKQESLPQMKERLQEALKLWKADTKENLDIVAKAKTIRDLNAAANAMQQAVISSNPEIAQDYGFKVSPTLSGLKYLRSLEKPTLKELLKDDDLVNAVKNTNIGSWGMIPKEQRERITAALQNNMPEDIRKEYATKNFGDSEFYYRYPRVEKVEFDNKEEYEAYKKGINVAGKYVSDPELGLYIEPVYTGSAKVIIPPGGSPQPVDPQKIMPSTMGKFPLYQAAPQALGYIKGLQPYSYYTPDYTHYEIAPPTLNIDTQLQSIDDSLQSTLRQSTGNASLDNARRSALFNQALAAKQQAFQAKQNYDAEGRFKADMYNTEARTKENYMDVSAAAQIYNEYMAAAQDAAERERMGAISSLTDNISKYYQDEYEKMFTFATMIPDFYYDGTDRANPIKQSPYSKNNIYSRWTGYNKPKSQGPSTPSVPPAFTPSTNNPTLTPPQPTPTPYDDMRYLEDYPEEFLPEQRKSKGRLGAKIKNRK